MAIATQNECQPYYTPGQNITAVPTVAVTGKRLVKISASRPAGPLLNTSTTGGNLQIVHATAAGPVLGVAQRDAAIGQQVEVITGGVVPITATGAIAFNVEVEAAANGTVSTYSAGIKVGYCVSAAVDGGDAQIKLY